MKGNAKEMNMRLESCKNISGEAENGTSSLDKLSPGEWGRVLSLTTPQPMRRRLLDLGFTQGSRVECVMRSPLGDPTAYLVRGALIALRREDAGTVNILNETV